MSYLEKAASFNITEELNHHLDNNIPLNENLFRVGSEKYYQLFREARNLYYEGLIDLEGTDKYLIEETDIGEFAEYEGQIVPLDCPMIKDDDEIEEEKKDPPIGKPMKGGPKKFYVYVRTPNDGVKKVTWGDTTGLKVRMNDPEARKSFAARHKCHLQKDRTTAAYWACHTPRYARQLGLSGGGNFFWAIPFMLMFMPYFDKFIF